MELQPVSSSNLKAVGYDGSTVRIQFQNSAIYEYTDVAQEYIDGLKNADSVGSYFNREFRANNKGVRVSRDES